MPKKIKVLSRTLNYGKMLLGRGGEYPVDDAFAKKCQAEGSAEIISDLGLDETSNAAKQVDEEFMAKVRHHAAEIMTVLQQESTQKDMQAAIDESSTATAAPVAEIDESSAKTKEIGESTENTVPIDELKGIVTAADNSNNVQSTPIPEDFPGFQVLTRANITTLEQLKELGYDDLIEAGVPVGTANQIGAKLVELNNNA